uniref:Uncharacterized protein n=1 Tax=Arundo donax TaxID=35708 RepID=A0A0A8Y6H8_ARUDO
MVELPKPPLIRYVDQIDDEASMKIAVLEKDKRRKT